MGRSYWFECSRCGYRATVSGREDRNFNFFIQTVSCADCKRLYDAVIRLRIPADQPGWAASSWRLNKPRTIARPAVPPSFESALSLLAIRGVRRFKWQRFKPQCPVSASHRITIWNDPGPCPRCGLPLEKNPLPYRIWD